MCSWVALALFHPLGMDTTGERDSIRHRPGLNPHLKVQSRLCTGKTFYFVSSQAKEL